MKCSVTFRHMKPSDAIKSYASEQVGRLDKYLDHGGEAHVTLTVEKHMQLASIELVTAGAMRVRADEKTEDMYASINEAVEKIVRQIERYRSRVREAHRDGGRKGRELAHQVLKSSIPVDAAEDAAPEKPQVVRQETMLAKEMNVDDAVLQMDLLNSDFLVFTDAISHNVSVMYRMPDGHYGLITAKTA